MSQMRIIRIRPAGFGPSSISLPKKITFRKPITHWLISIPKKLTTNNYTTKNYTTKN